MNYKEKLQLEIDLKQQLLDLEESFTSSKTKVPLSKGWYTQVYQQDMDKLLLELTQKELAVFIFLRQRFDKGPASKDRSSNLVTITIDEVVDSTLIGRVVVKAAISKLITFNMFQRIGMSGLKINPFVYIPMYSNGGELQTEWERLFGNKDGITL